MTRRAVVIDDRDAMPADARAILAQLLAATVTAIEAGDSATALASLDSVETVATNKLPTGEDRRVLLDGCGRVRTAIDDERPALAVAYLDSMRSHIAPVEN